MEDDLFTAEELGSRLKLKTDTIIVWARQGRIPARRLSRKVIRFSLTEVTAALRAAEAADPGSARRSMTATPPQADRPEGGA